MLAFTCVSMYYLCTNLGPPLARVPARGAVSFIDETNPSHRRLVSSILSPMSVARLWHATWGRQLRLAGGRKRDGSGRLAHTPLVSRRAEPNWKLTADLREEVPEGISRLVISATGHHILIVAWGQ